MSEQTDMILSRYEEWDPEDMTVEELCEDIGISKPGLYALLRRHGVTPKSRRPAVDPVAERLDKLHSDVRQILRKLEKMT